MDNRLMTITQVAKGLKVMPDDIVKLIREGKIKATETNGTYQVSVEEYQRYGRSFPAGLRNKMGEYFWKAQLELGPGIQKEVSERFKANLQIILNRDENAIMIMEAIHKKYEPQVEFLTINVGQLPPLFYMLEF